MSEVLVPVAEPVDVARTGPAQRVELVLPQLIVDAGSAAVERFLEFFAARIANRRTRAAYGRAVGQFLAWCEVRGLALEAVSPLHVAAYIRTHPGLGAHGQAAPGRHPHARRLARRQPGYPGEPGGGRAGAEARRHEGRDAGALAGRGPPAPRGDRHRRARGPARPGARLGDALQLPRG